MSRLPAKFTLRVEDFPDAPGWFSGVISQLNSFMSSVYNALNADLTFGENFRAQIYEGKIRSTELPLQIAKRDGRKVLGVIKLYAEKDTSQHTTVSSAVDIVWRDEPPNVKIYDIPGIDGDLWRYGIIIIYG
jgi:hypothetical protein